MVLCNIDKYCNQVKFQVLQLEFSNFWIQIASPENIRKIVWGALFVDQNLLEGGSESFFAYLPSIAGYIARSCSLERKNCEV